MYRGFASRGWKIAVKRATRPFSTTPAGGAKDKKHTRGKPLPKAVYKRWKLPDLLDAIRQKVLDAINGTAYNFHVWFTVESVARDFLAKLPW